LPYNGKIPLKYLPKKHKLRIRHSQKAAGKNDRKGRKKMEKHKKGRRLATQISAFITVVTVIGILLLWTLVSSGVTRLVRNHIINQMSDAVESRAAIINNYVSGAEEYMTAFALADEVRSLLLDPENPALLERAQQYTVDFAQVKGIFEGLYIATPDTHVLTHTSPGAIGITTRSGESLQYFQENMLSQSELTNSGIMVSPGTGNMVISMYYPLFENGTCIGYVGAAVFADQLMDALLDLTLKGLPGCEYLFLNAENGVYLYHEDETLLNTVTTDPDCLEIMERAGTGGTGFYAGNNGNFTVYKYLEDRGWVFMVRDSQSEIFRSVYLLQKSAGIVCALAALLIILISLLRLRIVGRDLMVVERAMDHLGRLELGKDSRLNRLQSRKDEIGMIASTTARVSRLLQETIADVDRTLGKMADGDLTSGAAQNASLYIGDFSSISDSLDTIRMKLNKLLGNAAHVSQQVTAGAQQLSAGAQTLAEGSVNQAGTINRLATAVEEISGHVDENTERAHQASVQAGETAKRVEQSKEEMDRMMAAMEEINTASDEISKIIKTIEDIAFQTNILALNAAVEAARAGEAGKGFSVVADEVRSLAEKSAEASRSTAVLIEKSIQSVGKGSALAHAAAKSLEQIVSMSETSAALIRAISDASAEQADAIAHVSEGLEQISGVVQTNSATSQESAAASFELSGQAQILKGLIAQFRL